ncbi:MAG: hypothetical protein ACKVJU_08325 [Verrucomicrobiales bacterium]
MLEFLMPWVRRHRAQTSTALSKSQRMQATGMETTKSFNRLDANHGFENWPDHFGRCGASQLRKKLRRVTCHSPMQKLIPAALLLFYCNALAVEQLPFDGDVFSIEGNPVFIIEPEKRAAGNPWVWYAPTLKNLPNQGHAFYIKQFLDKGIAVAGYHQGEVRGGPASSERFSAFYREVCKRGYSDKPILLGQSRGGLMMLSWAFRNPNKVGAFVGIYPVCNIASWPLKQMKQATLDDYQMTEAEILANLTKLNPPENLQ